MSRARSSRVNRTSCVTSSINGWLIVRFSGGVSSTCAASGGSPLSRATSAVAAARLAPDESPAIDTRRHPRRPASRCGPSVRGLDHRCDPLVHAAVDDRATLGDRRRRVRQARARLTDPGEHPDELGKNWHHASLQQPNGCATGLATRWSRGRHVYMLRPFAVHSVGLNTMAQTAENTISRLITPRVRSCRWRGSMRDRSPPGPR